MTPAEKLHAIEDIITAPTTDTATTPASPVRWWHATGLPPTTPLADLSNEDEIKRYASFGFRADLTRGVAPSDLPHMIELADRIGAAQSATEAEAVIARAGSFPSDTAIYLVLTGCTQGFSAFLTPTIFAPTAIQTVQDAALYATAKWTGGPGPSGR